MKNQTKKLKKEQQHLAKEHRCGVCNFWYPILTSKIRYLWGVCLASHGLKHKWTFPCTVFITGEDYIARDGVVYLSKYRFVNPRTENPKTADERCD